MAIEDKLVDTILLRELSIMQSNDHIWMPACIAQDGKEAKVEGSRKPNRGANHGEKKGRSSPESLGLWFWEELGLTIHLGSHQCPKALFGYCSYVLHKLWVILIEAYRGCPQPCFYLFDGVSSCVVHADRRLISTCHILDVDIVIIQTTTFARMVGHQNAYII